MKLILVLQRGWVVVGNLAEETEAKVRLTEAFIIRRWGTTGGLPQLAREGRQSDTILDGPCSVEAHPLAIVLRIPCEDSKWS